MRLIAVTTVVLALAACGSAEENGSGEAEVAQHESGTENGAAGEADLNQVQPVDDPSRPTPAGGGADGQSAGNSEMSWSFSRTGPGPKLAYGVPQTDNVRLMLRCPETGEALLSFLRSDQQAQNRPGTLIVAAGNAQRTLTIETQQGPLGTTVEAEIPVSSGPLEEFRSGKEMEVRWGDTEIRVPGASNGPVRQFFETCS